MVSSRLDTGRSTGLGITCRYSVAAPWCRALISSWSCQGRSGTPESRVAMVGRPALKVSCRSGAAGHRPVGVMCPEPLEGLRQHERDLNLG